MDQLLTVNELAEMLNVPVSWIYARTQKKGPQSIPHIKAGRYVRFEPERVMAWLRKHSECRQTECRAGG